MSCIYCIQCLFSSYFSLVSLLWLLILLFLPQLQSYHLKIDRCPNSLFSPFPSLPVQRCIMTRSFLDVLRKRSLPLLLIRYLKTRILFLKFSSLFKRIYDVSRNQHLDRIYVCPVFPACDCISFDIIYRHRICVTDVLSGNTEQG